MAWGKGAAVSLLVALVAAGCGGTGHPPSSRASSTSTIARPVHTHFPFGAFAGYLWTDEVSSIAGGWTVPAFLPNSADGVASSWIGAQGPDGATEFIQVGTNERMTPLGIDDDAFWSDTVKHFHPASLYVVRPGDRITASLVRHGLRWQVAITDITRHRSAVFGTAQDGAGQFDLGQWHQEDVTNNLVRRPFPYPDLGPVRFDELLVDDRPPTADELSTEWMGTPDGRVLAPSPVRGDGFVVAPLTRLPGPAAMDYLRLALTDDHATARVDEFITTLTPLTPRAEIASASASFDAALRQDVDGLERHRWPASVRRLIERLTAAVGVLERTTSHAAAVAPRARLAWLRAWFSDQNAVAGVGSAIRQAFRLPDNGRL